MKKLLLALMMMAPIATFAQKFGHINTQTIIQLMPEYTKAQTDLEARQKQYGDDIKSMQDEFQKKLEDYQKNMETLPDNVKQRKETELTEMQQKIQQTYQDYQQSLAKMEQDLMTEINNKIMNAIKEVGKAGGYTYIMNTMAESVVPYISDTQSTDVTAEVKVKLGLK